MKTTTGNSIVPPRATINDVARLAGVSIKTVSRVFNREPHVRPATRDRVIAASESLSYKPNPSARQLASKLTFRVAMLYDNPNSAYVTDVQYGSLQVCREYGYSLMIHPCQADSTDLITEVFDFHHEVDGLILFQPISDNRRLCELLVEKQVACVRVSQRPFEAIPWISVADSEAADEMTEHLLKLGHRRIGFIVGHPEHSSSEDRLAGYRSALQRHGIDVDEELVEQGLFDFDSGHACAHKLLASTPRPTAIFASNDRMAMGVLSAAHERGLRVPDELSVAGFDDSPLASHAWPPLTTARQPITEVARLATEVLMQKLRSRSDADVTHRLQAELVCRASTGVPPG